MHIKSTRTNSAEYHQTESVMRKYYQYVCARRSCTVWLRKHLCMLPNRNILRISNWGVQVDRKENCTLRQHEQTVRNITKVIQRCVREMRKVPAFVLDAAALRKEVWATRKMCAARAQCGRASTSPGTTKSKHFAYLLLRCTNITGG